jgi:DNA adenine methylase
MIKSPLRYPGGKSRVVKKIVDFIPAEFKEFREPLLGGGSLFIYLKQRFPKKQFWINDLYEPVYNFWFLSKKRPNKVISQILRWRVKFTSGKELHSYLKNNYDRLNNVQKASAFFVLNRITFSGATKSGGFSKESFRKRFTISSIERLKNLQVILPRTRITKFDYERLVKERGKGIFLYLDPPYYSATKSALYGKNGNLHKTFDHVRFAEVMKNCKHKWLVTYDDSDFIRKLFSFAKRMITYDFPYGMRSISSKANKNGKELFILNY